MLKQLKMLFFTMLLCTCFTVSAWAGITTNASQWAITAVEKGYQSGVVPKELLNHATQEITRKEFCDIAIGFYEKATETHLKPKGKSPFEDENSPNAIIAYELGIMNGISKTKFNPQGKLTREQMAMIIYNTVKAANLKLEKGTASVKLSDINQLGANSKEAIYALYQAGIISGYNGKYNPQNNVTVQEGISAFVKAYEIFTGKILESSNITQDTVWIQEKAITFGDSIASLKKVWGEPDRIYENAYGQQRYVYCNDYHDLFMVSVVEGHIVEVYTGSSSFQYQGISGKQKNAVVDNLKYLDKKLNRIELKNDNLDAYVLLDNEGGVDGILLRSKKYRSEYKKRFSAKFGKDMGLELFDLINAARIEKGQEPYQWSEKAATIAAKHSFDMKKNRYLGYNDANGATPFDRMTQGGISYTMAAETIAKADGDAIMVFHEWMSNIGTRSNILSSGFTNCGIGIEIENYSVYVTADFFN
ncbi:MAG: hypothetical protein GX299_00090 [Epulopiscium sp.]|jgi:hypothetical protein|nr:hypothetical protein [Candidatus Epulonipiscium sp.]